MQPLFAITLLVSATLLFAVQPMFAKMVLPRLGGTPSVWNTCMVFYQAMLLAALFFLDAGRNVWVLLLLHLAAFFVTAMVCHGELAATRPKATRLTEFYIWMSVGGVLGGLLNALVAPSLFPTVIEYPLVLVLACTLRPATASAARPVRARWLDLALPAGLAAVFAALVLGLRAGGVVLGVGGAAAILAPIGLAAFGFQGRPARFGLTVAAVLLVSLLCSGKGRGTLTIERSFYGVCRVSYDRRFDANVLIHGSTKHGMQRRDPARRSQPLCYYHRTGPVGDVFRLLADGGGAEQIGVIGLGTGSIAAYGRPGQRITFYEIDPAVERIARDDRYFTFLRDQPAEVRVVLGDARLTLAQAPPDRYDLLVLDAFSSDAIPVHLVTREALRLYLEKLADAGVLAMHVSNRYLDLPPVLGNLAADAGLACRIRRDDRILAADRAEGKLGSVWIVMARKSDDLGALTDDPRWPALPAHPGAPLWSDDFSNVVAVMKWW